MSSKATKGLTIPLVFAITAAVVGSGFQHGYNTGVVNAPEQLVKDFIDEVYRHRWEEPSQKEVNTFIFSIFVSIYAIGGMVGGLLTVIVAQVFGSRGGLLYNNALVFVGAALLGFSKFAMSYEMLIVGRFIVGLNSGLCAGLGPMYLTEISPISLRGAVGTLYQLLITISILISQILGLPQLLGTAERWPWLLGIIFVPAVLMWITLPFCPESPRHILIQEGKEENAKTALKWYRGTEEVEDEMEIMQIEYEIMKGVPKVNLRDMLTIHSLRRPFIISIVMMLSQQFSGINAVIYYSTNIFQKADISEQTAVYATLGVGAINVLMTVVSMILIEKAGRKTLHLIGLGGMAVVMLLLTVCMTFISDDTPWLSYLCMVLVFLFIVLFATGPGSIPWFLVSELFAQGPRPLATSIAVAVNWLSNFFVGLCFLPLTEVIYHYTFLIFVALLVLFFIFTLLQVPETKGRTIEEITKEFQ